MEWMFIFVVILARACQVHCMCSIENTTSCNNRGICNVTTNTCVCNQLDLHADPVSQKVDVFSTSDECRSIIHPCFFEVAPGGNVDQQTCNRRGFCKPESAGSTPLYKCTCHLPFSGPECETKDPCYIATGSSGGAWIQRDCNNHGTCQPHPTVPGLSLCNCSKGFFGPDCEFANLCAIDDTGNARAPDQPCHGGTCRNESTKISGIVTNTFVCNCSAGKSGELCNFDDPCVTSPCANGGVCVKTQADKTMAPSRACICLEGYLGKNCEQKNPCYFDTTYCKNAALCTRVNDTAMTCSCTQPFYEGTRCEVVNLCGVPDNSRCKPSFGRKRVCNPCKNGGTCSANKATVPIVNYSCNCTGTDAVGKYCEFKNGRVIIMPADLGRIPGTTHVDKFTASAGREQTYYIVALDLGTDAAVRVDTGNGFTFDILPKLFQPINHRILVFGAITIPDAMFYQFDYSYPNGTFTMKASVFNAGATGNGNQTEIASSVPPNVPCVPNSRLINVGRATATATHYKRTDRFVVEVVLEFNCYEDVWIDPASDPEVELGYEWKLHRLTSSYPVPGSENDWHVHRLTNSTEKFIVFEAHVLLEGLYWLECRAFVKSDGVEYGNSGLGFFYIKSSQPRIILKESSVRTVDRNSEIILDASSSVDTSFPEHSQYMEFSWKCDAPCPRRPWNGSILRIPPESFHWGDAILIHLDVTSPHSRTTASKSIQLLMRNVKLAIVCVRNCDKFNPGDEVVFKCVYERNGRPGPVDELELAWLPKGEVTPTFNVHNESYLTSVVLPSVKDVAPRTIMCRANSSGLHMDISMMNISINVPPRGGDCTASCVGQPTCGSDGATGEYLTTEFTISCPPFIDNHLPLHYSIYAESDGKLSKNLGGKILLSHDTNPTSYQLYLPFGNTSSGGKLNLTVKVTDSLGLSTEQTVPVTVTLPPAAQYPTLFENLIYGNKSVMKRRHLSGNTQGVLHLQMAAALGMFDQTISSSLVAAERDKLMDTVEKYLVNVPLHTFKATEQMIHTIHCIDHVENREQPDVLTDVGRVLFQSSAKLAHFVQQDEEITAQLDVDTLTQAASDSTWRILRAAHALGGQLTESQPNYAKVNQRDVFAYDTNDDQDRDYFIDVHDEDDDFISEGFDEVADGVSTLVKQYSKVAHHSLFTFEHVLNAAVDSLGYKEDFNQATEDVSIHSSILEDQPHDEAVSVQTATPGSKVDILFPKELRDVIRDQIETDVELQITEVQHNPFYDDSSANPHTPVVNIVLEDVNSHVPIPLEKLPHPLRITLPRRLPLAAELDAGQSFHTVDIIPAYDIDDNTEFPVLHQVLPYNTKVYIDIRIKSSPTMIFKIVVTKDRKPTLRDICNNPAIETTPGGYTAEFTTEHLGINDEVIDPYLDYYVGILALDPNQANTRQSFSVVFARLSCLHRDEDRKFWSEEGCVVDTEATSDTHLHCLCNHASILSGVQFIAPHSLESVDVLEFSLEEIGRNPVVLICVGVILLLYLIGLAICRLYDERDARKNVGLAIMADLKESSAGQLYLITVSTGCNFWAGTTSSVCLILYGSGGRSKTFTLKDRSISVLRRGGVDTFLVSCDKDLGVLERIRLWTNFSGADPAWYCRKIFIRSVKSQKSWYFYVNRWLTVSAFETSIILDVPATTQEEIKMFTTRFKENVLQHFDNVNLWFSLFRYSPASTFTRCQRLTCAFGVLTSYLLIDILFHGTPTADEGGIVEFGEHAFDIYGYIKGIQIVFIALPFGILMVSLFGYIVPRYKPTIIVWNNVIPATATLNDKNVFVPKLANNAIPPSRPEKDVIMLNTSDEEESSEKENLPKKTRPRPTGLDGASRSSSSSSSNFSIPSTDIPLAEQWIQSDQSIVKGLDPVADENREANNISRLGRAAIIHSVRDYDPAAFIFKGENDVRGLEDLIDDAIQGRHKPAKERKNKRGSSEGTSPEGTPEEKSPKLKKKPPWKKAVTEEYLEDLDKTLEKELITKHKMQDKENWESHVALEICLLPCLNVPFLSWPWWFVFIAWFVCICVILVTCTITVQFGLHYGYLRSLKWLECFINSFLISVLVIQPLNGCIIALLSTLLGQRQPINERIQIVLEDSSNKSFLSSRLPYHFRIFQSVGSNQPLTGNEIFRLTMNARRKNELQGKLVRLVLCVFLIIPLITVSYSDHNHENYEVTSNIRKMLELNILGQARVQFRSEESVYDYIEHIVIRSLHPEKLYNGQTIEKNEPTLLSDQQTLLVGVSRVRQHRVDPSACVNQDTEAIGPSAKCHAMFTKWTQDRDNYNVFWDPATESRSHPSSLTNDGWKFHNGTSTKQLSLTFSGNLGTYDGGGYILELGRTRRESASVLKYMKRTRWLDHRTRAIFVEFTLLSPNINKFIDVVLLIEQGPTWAFTLTSWISPVDLIPIEDLGNSDQFTWISVSLAVILIILLCLVYLFIEEVVTTHKLLRYQKTRFWLDFAIIVFVTSSLCVSLMRFLSVKEFAASVDQKKIDDYISIQTANYWNHRQQELFSITQAFVFIKIWKLLMFTDKRFLTFALTLKLTSGFLLAFLVIIFIFLCAFAFSGFFLFGQELWAFSTWGESMTTLVDQILGVSLFDDITQGNTVFGAVYSFLFGFIIVFLGLNFVVALLDLGVHEAKEVVQQRKVWLTYSSYFLETLLKSFPILRRTMFKNQKEPLSTLPPERVHGMKMATATFIRNFVLSHNQRTTKMREHCNKLLNGTGYQVVSKREKSLRKEQMKQEHIEQLRKMAEDYFKEKLGHDMTPEEFKEYADFNRSIVELRVKKMEGKLEKLCEKINEFVDRM